jgi:hypothetical protein
MAALDAVQIRFVGGSVGVAAAEAVIRQRLLRHYRRAPVHDLFQVLMTVLKSFSSSIGLLR